MIEHQPSEGTSDFVPLKYRSRCKVTPASDTAKAQTLPQKALMKAPWSLKGL